MDIFLGFDPGGARDRHPEPGFGWSICQVEIGLPMLRVVISGLGRNAQEVINIVTRELENRGLQNRVRSAGIDAPLFWTETGIRLVDGIIDEALEGADYGYRVQKINSLMGACLVQGVLLADQIHRQLKCPITEVHPGALNRLDIGMIGQIVNLPVNPDKRDATFAAYAAWHIDDPNWRNLFLEEQDPILPLNFRVSYWMPIP